VRLCNDREEVEGCMIVEVGSSGGRPSARDGEECWRERVLFLVGEKLIESVVGALMKDLTWSRWQ
jgi:hypothetical protein